MIIRTGLFRDRGGLSVGACPAANRGDRKEIRGGSRVGWEDRLRIGPEDRRFSLLGGRVCRLARNC